MVSNDAAHPSWLTADFVQQVLRHVDDVEVEQVDVTPIAVGDHHASTLLRVQAKLTSGSHSSLIIKTLPVSETMLETVKESFLFETETLMLSDLIPNINTLLEAKVPSFQTFAPKCLHHGSQPVDFIVMEDLNSGGFRLADRFRGLGLRHSLLAVTTLGRFHGASIPLIQKNPKLRNILTNYLVNPGKELRNFVETSFQSVAVASRSWKNFPEEYTKIIDSLAKSAVDGFSKLATNSQIDVILHGVFWTNNMMFRYEGSHPVEVKILDFQTCSVGPAVLDLLYFLNTSFQEEVSEKYTDLLTREYHRFLGETMGILGLVPPTLEELISDIEERGFYSLFGALCVTPHVKARKECGVDVERNLKGEMGKNLHAYASPVVERFLKRVLPVFYQKGWLSIKN